MEPRNNSIGQWAFDALRSALAALAAPAPEQEASLRHLGVPGAVDELALTFDDANQMVAQLCAAGWLTDATVTLLRDLDGQLLAMSGPDGPWALTDLHGSEQWAVVRNLARAAIDSMTTRGALRVG